MEKRSQNCNWILAVQLLGQLICHSKVTGAEYVDWRSTCVVSIMECAFFDTHPTEWQPRLNELYLRLIKIFFLRAKSLLTGSSLQRLINS